MMPQCTHAAKLETQQEERQLRTATLPPQATPSAAQENAGEEQRTVLSKGSTHTSIHQRPTAADIEWHQRRHAAEKAHVARRWHPDGSPPVKFRRPACGF
ncbi:hypothetical protein TcYC6_0026250 [Trypanosoma cruzi]|nr:hypothetical protein TcYC6_0026250 [Trypanosoma cruzi]